MKLKERLRIAWQVLTKGTCKGFDEELIRRNRLSLTYNYEAIYYPKEELWSSDVDRMACEYFAKQLLKSGAVSIDQSWRLDKPIPLRSFYQIDVLMPEE